MNSHSLSQLIRYDSHSANAASLVDPLIRATFYAFIFSLFLEQGVNLSLPMQIPTLVGCLLVMVACLQPSICYRLPSSAFWWFFGYLCIFALSIGVHGDAFEHGERVFKEAFLLVQAFVIFWISSNLLTDTRTARGAQVALAVACAVVALGLRLGLGDTALPRAGDRETALGQNPNVFGGLMSLGFLAILSLAWGERALARSYRYAALAVLALVGWAIVSTGSRSVLPSLAIGILIFGLAGGTKTSRAKKIITLGSLVLFLAVLTYFNEATRYRFEASLAGGDMAGREQIYPAAWQMFLEEPILGWGPVIRDFELQRRVQHHGFQNRDPHNLYLGVLTNTGLLGAVPFFVGIWLCGRSAWMARHRRQGILPFALLVLALTLNMSGNWLYFKMFWLVLAYSLASGRPDPTRQALSPELENNGPATSSVVLQGE